MDGNNFLTEAEAAQFLRLPPRTLEGFRYRGGGPRYCKLGRRVLYRRKDLEAWAEARARFNTHERREAA